MVDRLRLPEGAPEERWPRDWISWERYRILHENRIEALIREGIIVRNEVRFRDPHWVDGVLQARVEGEIGTASGGVIHVLEWLAVRTRHGRPQVRATRYGYHGRVRVRGGGSVDVVRYDNTHGDTDTLHRHAFNDSGRDIGKEPLAPERLPPLGDIVAEVERHARRRRARRTPARDALP